MSDDKQTQDVGKKKQTGGGGKKKLDLSFVAAYFIVSLLVGALLFEIVTGRLTTCLKAYFGPCCGCCSQ